MLGHCTTPYCSGDGGFVTVMFFGSRTGVGGCIRFNVYFWKLLSLYSAKRRIGGDSGSPGGRRRIRGIPLSPPSAPTAGGWGIPGSALRRVDRRLWGGAAVAGWPASSFCCAAASPPRRRLRWCFKAAGASPFCRCFSGVGGGSVTGVGLAGGRCAGRLLCGAVAGRWKIWPPDRKSVV